MTPATNKQRCCRPFKSKLGWSLAARQGKWNEALSEYDEALKYAPAWTELYLARDAAEKRAG